MGRNADYIFDAAGGWQPITPEVDEMWNTSSFEEDHIQAIANAGYTINQSKKIAMQGFTIEFYFANYDANYPHLLEVSTPSEINVILIPNYISLQKCVAELISNRKSYASTVNS